MEAVFSPKQETILSRVCFCSVKFNIRFTDFCIGMCLQPALVLVHMCISVNSLFPLATYFCTKKHNLTMRKNPRDEVSMSEGIHVDGDFLFRGP